MEKNDSFFFYQYYVFTNYNMYKIRWGNFESHLRILLVWYHRHKKEVSCMIIHVICYQCNPTMLFQAIKKERKNNVIYLHKKWERVFLDLPLHDCTRKKSEELPFFVLLITSIFIVLIYRNLPYYNVISFVVNFFSHFLYAVSNAGFKN